MMRNFICYVMLDHVINLVFSWKGGGSVDRIIYNELCDTHMEIHVLVGLIFGLKYAR